MPNPEVCNSKIIEKTISLGERKALFHREPNMKGSGAGVVCIDWMRGESPTATYYVLMADGEFGRFGLLMNEVFHPRCERWLEGELDSMTWKRDGLEIRALWEEIFNPRIGVFEVEGAYGTGDPYLLRITAQPHVVVRDIPKE